MSSAVFNNEEAANNSQAKKKVDQQRAAQQSRGRYSNPTLASQLNDKASRDSDRMLDKQFIKTSQSSKPAPGIDASNWGSKNAMLIQRKSNITSPKRKAGPTKDRNMISSSTGQFHDISIKMAGGGELSAQKMMKFVLSSGMFDDAVKARYAAIEEGDEHSPPTKVSFNFYPDVEAVVEMNRMQKEKRKVAEQNQSTEEVANHPESGAMTEEFDLDDIGAAEGMMGGY